MLPLPHDGQPDDIDDAFIDSLCDSLWDDINRNAPPPPDDFIPFVPSMRSVDALPDIGHMGALGNSTYLEKHPARRALSLSIWLDGSLVQMQRIAPDLDHDINQANDFNNDSINKGGGPRGLVNFLSPAARRRLSEKLAQVKRSAPCHFLTLTYPGDAASWSPELSANGPPTPLPGPMQSKYDLRLFAKWIKYQYPNFSYFWKLEPQTRGVPHFHLIAFGLPDDPKVIQSLRDRWHEQVGRGQTAHQLYGFDADYLGTDADKARAYISKYVAKGAALTLNPDHGRYAGSSSGRFWGIEYADVVPFSDCIDFPIEDELKQHAIRIVRRMQQAKLRQSFLARVSKFTNLPVNAVHELKHARSLAHRWAKLVDRQRWGNFPKYRDPFRFAAVMRNNFTKDPREFVSRLLDAVTVTATHSPPDKLAGPLGRLP